MGAGSPDRSCPQVHPTASVPRGTTQQQVLDYLSRGNKPEKLTRLQEEEGERWDCRGGKRKLQGRNKLVQELRHTTPEIPVWSDM